MLNEESHDLIVSTPSFMICFWQLNHPCRFFNCQPLEEIGCLLTPYSKLYDDRPQFPRTLDNKVMNSSLDSRQHASIFINIPFIHNMPPKRIISLSEHTEITPRTTTSMNSAQNPTCRIKPLNNSPSTQHNQNQSLHAELTNFDSILDDINSTSHPHDSMPGPTIDQSVETNATPITLSSTHISSQFDSLINCNSALNTISIYDTDENHNHKVYLIPKAHLPLQAHHITAPRKNECGLTKQNPVVPPQLHPHSLFTNHNDIHIMATEIPYLVYKSFQALEHVITNMNIDSMASFGPCVPYLCAFIARICYENKSWFNQRVIADNFAYNTTELKKLYTPTQHTNAKANGTGNGDSGNIPLLTLNTPVWAETLRWVKNICNLWRNNAPFKKNLPGDSDICEGARGIYTTPHITVSKMMLVSVDKTRNMYEWDHRDLYFDTSSTNKVRISKINKWSDITKITTLQWNISKDSVFFFRWCIIKTCQYVDTLVHSTERPKVVKAGSKSSSSQNILSHQSFSRLNSSQSLELSQFTQPGANDKLCSQSSPPNHSSQTSRSRQQSQSQSHSQLDLQVTDQQILQSSKNPSTKSPTTKGKKSANAKKITATNIIQILSSPPRSTNHSSFNIPQNLLLSPPKVSSPKLFLNGPVCSTQSTPVKNAAPQGPLQPPSTPITPKTGPILQFFSPPTTPQPLVSTNDNITTTTTTDFSQTQLFEHNGVILNEKQNQPHTNPDQTPTKPKRGRKPAAITQSKPSNATFSSPQHLLERRLTRSQTVAMSHARSTLFQSPPKTQRKTKVKDTEHSHPLFPEDEEDVLLSATTNINFIDGTKKKEFKQLLPSQSQQSHDLELPSQNNSQQSFAFAPSIAESEGPIHQHCPYETFNGHNNSRIRPLNNDTSLQSQHSQDDTSIPHNTSPPTHPFLTKFLSMRNFSTLKPLDKPYITSQFPLLSFTEQLNWVLSQYVSSFTPTIQKSYTLTIQHEVMIYCVTHILLVASEFGSRPFLYTKQCSINEMEYLTSLLSSWLMYLTQWYPTSHALNRELVTEIVTCLYISKHNGILLTPAVLRAMRLTTDLCLVDYHQRWSTPSVNAKKADVWRNGPPNVKECTYIPIISFNQDKDSSASLFAQYHTHFLLGLLFAFVITDTFGGMGTNNYPTYNPNGGISLSVAKKCNTISNPEPPTKPIFPDGNPNDEKYDHSTVNYDSVSEDTEQYATLHHPIDTQYAEYLKYKEEFSDQYGYDLSPLNWYIKQRDAVLIERIEPSIPYTSVTRNTSADTRKYDFGYPFVFQQRQVPVAGDNENIQYKALRELCGCPMCNYDIFVIPHNKKHECITLCALLDEVRINKYQNIIDTLIAEYEHSKTNKSVQFDPGTILSSIPSILDDINVLFVNIPPIQSQWFTTPSNNVDTFYLDDTEDIVVWEQPQFDHIARQSLWNQLPKGQGQISISKNNTNNTGNHALKTTNKKSLRNPQPTFNWEKLTPELTQQIEKLTNFYQQHYLIQYDPTLISPDGFAQAEIGPRKKKKSAKK